MVVLSRHPTYPQPVGLDELFTGARRARARRRGPSRPGRWTPWFQPGDAAGRARYNRRPLRAAAPPGRGAASRAGSATARRPTARGAASSRRGSTRSSPCTRSGYPLDHPVDRAGAGRLRRHVPPATDGERLRIAGLPVAGLGHLPRPRSPWPTPACRPGRPGACAPRLRRGCCPRRSPASATGARSPAAGRPGGWSFEFENDWYPDTDDTAEVLHRPAPRRPPAATTRPSGAGSTGCWPCRAANGGWGAFDVDNDRRVMTQLPLCDFGEVIDPPTEDVTAHVVEALVHCGVPAAPPGGAARRRLPAGATQRAGRLLVGPLGRQPRLRHRRRAARARRGRRGHGRARASAAPWPGWPRTRTPDGGWGERVASYADPAWIGRGAVHGLPDGLGAAGAAAPPTPAHPAVAGGVALPGARPRSTTARGRSRTSPAPGSPMDFMINYHLYRDVFPVTALARWVTWRERDALAREAGAAGARARRAAHDENFPVAFLLAPARRARRHARGLRVLPRHRRPGRRGRAGGPARWPRSTPGEADLRALLRRRAARPAPARRWPTTIARARPRPPTPSCAWSRPTAWTSAHDRWATYDDLLGYCEHSATPVGRMVLGVLGYRDPWRVGHERRHLHRPAARRTSGRTSRRDLRDRGRVYLPREDMARFGVAEDDLRRPRATPAVRGARRLRGRPGPRTAWSAGRPLRARRAAPGRPRPAHVHAPAGSPCATRSRARATTRSGAARRPGGWAARASPPPSCGALARGGA